MALEQDWELPASMAGRSGGADRPVLERGAPKADAVRKVKTRATRIG